MANLPPNPVIHSSRPNMFTFHTFATGLAIVAASAVSWSAPLRDGELDDALQGVWCSSDDGGKSCQSFDEFSKGTIASCGRDPATQASIAVKARYEIRGNTGCAVITEASAGFALQPGDRYCVVVLDISAHTQRFRVVGSDEVTTVYRVPRARMRCPGVDS